MPDHFCRAAWYPSRSLPMINSNIFDQAEETSVVNFVPSSCSKTWIIAVEKTSKYSSLNPLYWTCCWPRLNSSGAMAVSNALMLSTDAPIACMKREAWLRKWVSRSNSSPLTSRNGKICFIAGLIANILRNILVPIPIMSPDTIFQVFLMVTFWRSVIELPSLLTGPPWCKVSLFERVDKEHPIAFDLQTNRILPTTVNYKILNVDKFTENIFRYQYLRY